LARIVPREMTPTFVWCCTRPTSLLLSYSPLPLSPQTLLATPEGLRRVGRGLRETEGVREGERVNGGSHISSVLIFHDISPHCCLQIICHLPFYALRLLARSDVVLLSISSKNKMHDGRRTRLSQP